MKSVMIDRRNRIQGRLRPFKILACGFGFRLLGEPGLGFGDSFQRISDSLRRLLFHAVTLLRLQPARKP